jgi:colanic acid biosynthesis glycosyl transferase WcaI
MTARRLIIVTQWYPPEQAPFGVMMQQLANYLTGCGWHVEIVTGFPNHPRGVVFGGYRKRWLLQERKAGVTVNRVWLATSANRSIWCRLLGFASFTLAASWCLARMSRAPLVFAVLQPLSVAVTLPLIAACKRSSLVFNLQDLHPDAQIRLGLLRNKLLIRSLRVLERHAYRSCAAITAISGGFAQHCIARGAAPERVQIIGNWIDTEAIKPAYGAASLALRAQCGLDEHDFVVLFAGTLGHASGAHQVLDAVEQMGGSDDVKFLIVGEGPLAESMHDRVRRSLLRRVRFLPFQPADQINAVQNIGNVALVTLRPDAAETSVPSKVLAYLAASLPQFLRVVLQP